MLSLGRAALASCCWLALGCGQSPIAEPGMAGSGGAANPAAGRGGSLIDSGAGGGAGSTPTESGGAGQASSAGTSGGPAEAGPAGAGGRAEPGDVATILDTYRSFAAQTPAPVSVSGYIFGLCRSPTLRETEFQASLHGDGRYLQDFANPLAVQGLAARGEPAFAVGAVIVKEKYAGPAAAQAKLVAIGLMIKREAGFDSAHGDWDYAYYEPALGVVQTAEQTAYCVSCHAGAAATDFVYVDGLKP